MAEHVIGSGEYNSLSHSPHVLLITHLICFFVLFFFQFLCFLDKVVVNSFFFLNNFIFHTLSCFSFPLFSSSKNMLIKKNGDKEKQQLSYEGDYIVIYSTFNVLVKVLSVILISKFFLKCILITLRFKIIFTLFQCKFF